MTIQEAIHKISLELITDSEYRQSIVSIIAMSYMDNEEWYKSKTGKKTLTKEDKHNIANLSAEYLIDILTRSIDESEILEYKKSKRIKEISEELTSVKFSTPKT